MDTFKNKINEFFFGKYKERFIKNCKQILFWVSTK